jgi:pilus assembly protein Flp/PilA
MRISFQNLTYRLHNFLNHEDGQDLVEYALVVALVAFGAVAGEKALSSGINNAFSKISAALSANIT